MIDVNSRIVELALKRAINGYTWYDIAETINQEFGTNLNADSCRKRASRYEVSERNTNKIELSSIIDDECDSENLLDFDELDVLRTQMKDERAQVNALFKRMNRENSLMTLAKELVGELSEMKPLTSMDKIYNAGTLNEALLLISDWHYGVEIHNYMNSYTPDICRQRVSELAKAVIEKIKLNKISKLHVLNLGDMIAGIIHLQLRINSRKDVLSQIMEVSEILADFIYDLSKYAEIEYYSVLDNHSRLDPNKKEAMNLESLARLTPWWLKERFNRIEKEYHAIHINDNEIDPDIASFYINDDFLVVGVHGDDDKQSNIIPKLNLFIKEPIHLISSAHLHHCTITEDNRTVLISNGSLMGTDDYAFQKRLDSMPSQTFITFKSTDIGTDIDGIYKINSYIFS